MSSRVKSSPKSEDSLHSVGLVHLPKLSAGFRNSGNLIIQGENLKTLEMLLPVYEGRVRCCYIDPPYNNQEKYYHYHDSREHRAWLDDLVARIEILGEFLSDNGSLWISIDDREVHYLKVACDEVLSRKNFVSTIVWQQRTSRENRKVFSNNHEYILVYAKDIKKFAATRNGLDLSEDIKARYKNPDHDPRGPWQSVSAHAQAGHGTPDQFYIITAPNGNIHYPPAGRCWVYNLKRMQKEIAAKNISFGKDGNGVPRIKRFLSEIVKGLTPETLWKSDEVGTNDQAKKQILRLFPDQAVFDTPKPESLIKRILEIATSPGDLVLDAYLGSATTAAVAHKIGRKYIGIEEGDHASTICARRLAMVVEGEDSGISTDVGWQGGGGFDFYRLR